MWNGGTCFVWGTAWGIDCIAYGRLLKLNDCTSLWVLILKTSKGKYTNVSFLTVCHLSEKR